MDTLLSMQVFRLVVEQQSFVAAARRLEMSPAMVSKHVMALERRLGTRLLNRTSRQLSLTESGVLYFEQAGQMLDALEDLEAKVSKSTLLPRGTLKVSAPVWFANPTFVRMLATYQARYLEVRLDLDLSGRMANLVEEGIDLAFRIASNPVETLISRRIGSIRFMLVAAPAYFETRQRPVTLGDLHRLTTVSYSLTHFSALPINGPHGKEFLTLPPSILESNNESLLMLAALQGMGLACLPHWLVANDLTAGRLEVVLPQYQLEMMPLYGVYTSRRHLSSKVKTFLDFMVENGQFES